MSTTPILNITEVLASQNQKEVTINNAFLKLEGAITGRLVPDYGVLDSYTLSADELLGNAIFEIATQPADVTLLIPAVANGNPTTRLFVVTNKSGHGVTVGSVTTGHDTVIIPNNASRLLSITEGLDVIVAAEPSTAVHFTDLVDTPTDYTAMGGKILAVKNDLSGLEFINLSKALPDPAGNAGKVLTVNGAANGYELDTPVHSINDLNDVDNATTPPTDGQALVWHASDGQYKPGNVAGGSSLPPITGKATKVLTVKSDETGYDWEAPTGGTGGAALPSFTGNKNKVLTVSDDETVALWTADGRVPRAARYWRLKMISVSPTATSGNFGMCNVQMLDASGANLSTDTTKAFADSDAGVFGGPPAAFDGGTSVRHGWYSTLGPGAWIGYDFTTPVAIRTMHFQNIFAFNNTCGGTVAVEWSDDAVTWTESVRSPSIEVTDGSSPQQTIHVVETYMPFARTLGELDDVDTSAPPTDGQAIVWNETLGKYVPGDVASGGGGGSGGGAMSAALKVAELRGLIQLDFATNKITVNATNTHDKTYDWGGLVGFGMHGQPNGIIDSAVGFTVPAGKMLVFIDGAGSDAVWGNPSFYFAGLHNTTTNIDVWHPTEGASYLGMHFITGGMYMSGDANVDVVQPKPLAVAGDTVNFRVASSGDGNHRECAGWIICALVDATTGELSAIHGGGSGTSGPGDLIGTVTFAGGETEHTFAVPPTFTDLDLSFLGNLNGSGDVDIIFNGDTNEGNYFSQHGNKYGQGTAAYGLFFGGTNNAGKPLQAITRISAYNNSTWTKQGSGKYTFWNDTDYFDNTAIFEWNNTAAITSVTIKCRGTDTFRAGSQFSVFGVGAVAASGGAGGRILIREVITSGSAASVDFNAIPQTFRDLEIRIQGWSDSADGGASAVLIIHFNGDATSGNYERTGFGVYGGGPTGFPALGGVLLSSFNAGQQRGQGKIELQDYVDSDQPQFWHGTSDLRQGTAGLLSCYGTGSWNVHDAITSIQLMPTGYNWQDGSKVQLYGLL